MRIGILGLTDRNLHPGHFLIAEHLEQVLAFSVRELPVILKAATDKQVDKAIRHVNHFLNGAFGFVIIDQKTQFFHQLNFNGFIISYRYQMRRAYFPVGLDRM